MITEFGSGSAFAGRPGLMDLLRRVEGGLVKALVTPRLDRLSRSENSEDVRVMVQTLLDHNIKVITETEVFDLGLPQDVAR